MGDILIRGVPDSVVAALDEKARLVGLSRSEYVRRTLARESARSQAAVSVDDFRWLSETFADLGDSEVIGDAWT